MHVAYFAHELADAAVQKRRAMLEQAGCTVSLLGFARDRGAGAPEAPGAHVLGRTRNGRFVERVMAIAAALPKARALRREWAGADVLIARNLEMLMLARMLTFGQTKPRIVYECLDIHRLALAGGPAGALVRALERACMKRAALIVTSSPAFEQHYFRTRQGYRGEVLLLENKVLGEAAAAAPAPAGPPWRIAWCGVLRCRRSFDLLRAIAEAQAGRVLIDLWGAPAFDQIPDFHEQLAASHNIAYRGRYTPEQLPAIYADAHFAWAVDFYEQGGNSDWLLPNRLYESLAFGATPIAAAGVETARWLSARNVGVVLEAPLEESLPAFLNALTPDAYARAAAAARGLDPEATRFTAIACRAFADKLARLAA
ncbi:MAG: glycosyl transferase family 1 [Hyphomonadaceae bacterium]|nr:glycosyl transferase family 1 [Hyphomonadaceae bacterium]